MKQHYTKESDLIRDAIDYFKLQRIFAWRMPISAVIHKQGKGDDVRTFFKKHPLKGFPDFAGILRKKHRGVLFALECKTATGKPTPEQLHWITQLQISGGKAAIVRSVQDIHLQMIEWGEVTSV